VKPRFISAEEDDSKIEIRRDRPEDYGWAVAQWLLEGRKEHPERVMRSGQSKGPVKMYLCDSCMITVTSTSSVAPVCAGR